MPLISVLIPCHNAALWLQVAIDSVRAQTHRDLEILVYDDGSTDNSREIIRKSAAEDARIVAMGEPANRGIVHALNTMLRTARGDYIARMDGDDVCLPHRFERQLRFIEAGNAELCGTWFQEFGDGIARTVRWCCGADELRGAMLFQNTICHPTIMAKREVFEAFGYRKNYNLAEDYDLFVRALARFRLANLPEVLLRYRRHKQQATRARRAQMEEVTCRIRIEALRAQGINASVEEQRAHNLVRAPQSIVSIDDLDLIEAWLLKLLDRFDHPDTKRVIASQWTRAAVRAAPQGWTMWRRYRGSPLHGLLGKQASGDLDLAVLAALRLDYGSQTFEVLRRFGLSA
ncbi:glycosyltransferase family 2 protein [Rhodanobacter sp. Si-c]|uniref:Glycosyltransferase family 2 protein n=1 Tax=Rhodanobacter lycopersici TaxID=3162487 RepID=A0ABV3QBW7_9GAMM